MMEDNALHRPAMVSRLPKFGVRPASCAGPLPNGSEQPVPRREWKSQSPGRTNGMLRMSYPSALKVKTTGENGVGSPSSGLGLNSEEPGEVADPRRGAVVTREIRKPSASFSHLRRSAPPNTLPSPCVTQPVPGAASRGTSSLSFHGNKPKGQNGLGGGPAGLYRPGLRRQAVDPSSTQVNLRPSLSHSSDSLKGPALDNMVRSQSFPHFRQLTSPVSLPAPRTRARSRSLLGKPTSGLTAKGPAARPGPAVTACAAPPSGVKKSLLPNSALGKPVALSYRLMRPSLTKQQRPTPPGEAQGDAEAGRRSRDSVETPPVSPDPPSETELVPGTEGLPEDPPGPVPRTLTEGLEDMSLSSSSSLERNDTSEEYLDDFDNLGDASGLLLLLPSPKAGLHQLEPGSDDNIPGNRGDAPIRASLRSLLSDDMDWAGMGLSGGRDDFGVSGRRGDRVRSPEGEFPHGSSLDLSPSDSSGGTYMWDEEGLEPLGVTTHPCGSYDSDINSMDILNNLDNLESCDLEDDDLMLDVDLPDDASLRSDTDGTSRSERSEKGGRQAPWRRRPLRWTAQDDTHDDNRGDGYEVPRVDGGEAFGVAVEELMLKDMAQDFSSVTSQLLTLRRLLEMENEIATQDDHESETPSPEVKDDPSAASQVEALMREARELREELRKKEQTILLLTQQMSTSAQGDDCPCQQKAAGDERSSRDQATQTLWRGHVGVLPAPFLSPWRGSYQGPSWPNVPHHRQRVEQLVHFFRDKAWYSTVSDFSTIRNLTPQVLQPSIPCPSVQLASGRLTRTTSTEDPGDVPRSASVDVSPRSGSGSPLDLEDSAAAAAVCSAPGSHGLRTHHGAELPGRSAFITGATGAIGHPGPVEQPPRPLSGPYADVRHLRFPRERAPAPTQLPGYPSSSSTTRAPLRVRAMEGVARTRVGAAAPLKTKQLPPPSRGLPCFSSGPPAPTASSVNPSALGPPRPRGQREQPGGREPEGGLGKTRGQVPPNQSRLPKPKIH